MPQSRRPWPTEGPHHRPREHIPGSSSLADAAVRLVVEGSAQGGLLGWCALGRNVARVYKRAVGVCCLVWSVALLHCKAGTVILHYGAGQSMPAKLPPLTQPPKLRLPDALQLHRLRCIASACMGDYEAALGACRGLRLELQQSARRQEAAALN